MHGPGPKEIVPRACHTPQERHTKSALRTQSAPYTIKVT